MHEGPVTSTESSLDEPMPPEDPGFSDSDVDEFRSECSRIQNEMHALQNRIANVVSEMDDVVYPISEPITAEEGEAEASLMLAGKLEQKLQEQIGEFKNLAVETNRLINNTGDAIIEASKTGGWPADTATVFSARS